MCVCVCVCVCACALQNLTVAVVKGMLSMKEDESADTHTISTRATNICSLGGTFCEWEEEEGEEEVEEEEVVVVVVVQVAERG